MSCTIFVRSLLYGFRRDGATEHSEEEYRKISQNHFAKVVLAMSKVLQLRARYFPNEAELSETKVAHVWTSWMHEWCDEQLRPDQREKTANQKSNIFGAYVRKTVGHKKFVLATLQCGPNLMPSAAAEHARSFKNKEAHAAQSFEELLEWLARFVDAVLKHSDDPKTQEARRRSGLKRRQSGLTSDDKRIRDQRDEIHRRLRQAKALKRELAADKNGDFREFEWPRSWYQMAAWEHAEIQALENGDLQRSYDAAAAAHGGKVEATPFRI